MTKELTLKTGPRKNPIPIPFDLRPIVARRVAECAILFPEPAARIAKRKRNRKGNLSPNSLRLPPSTGNLPWRNPETFSRKFNQALVIAGRAANIEMQMDARVGRRTCASLLLQHGIPIATIAELLGNSPEQILAAYGDPNIKTMSLSATELKPV